MGSARENDSTKMSGLFHRYAVPLLLAVLAIEVGFVISELKTQTAELKTFCDIRTVCKVRIDNPNDLGEAIGRAVRAR